MYPQIAIGLCHYIWALSDPPDAAEESLAPEELYVRKGQFHNILYLVGDSVIFQLLQRSIGSRNRIIILIA